MKYKDKNKKVCKKDIPFSSYRFLIYFGIVLLTIIIIILCMHFYIKFKEPLFLILVILISLTGLSHIVSRISVKVVKYVYKKENNK